VVDPDDRRRQSALATTSLAKAPIVPVSVRTRSGLEALRQALAEVLAERTRRPDLGRARLSIDRVFTQVGFGSVVTGTLIDGSLAVGDAVEILPGRVQTRVRGLQTHKLPVARAQPGSRVAVNLAGVDLEALGRGMTIAQLEAYRPTALLDVQIRVLADGAPLGHQTQLKVYAGADEVMARLRLMGTRALAPGTITVAQLACERPLVVAKGDRLILRRPSPATTVAGAVVVDAHPPRRYRPKDTDQAERLAVLVEGGPEDVLEQTLTRLGPVSLDEALRASRLEPGPARVAAQTLRERQALVNLDGERLVWSRAGWGAWLSELTAVLGAYHRNQRLAAGMPREELKSRLSARSSGLSTKMFNALLAVADAQSVTVSTPKLVRLSTHAITFTPAEQERIDALLAHFRRDPVNTPSVKGASALVGEAVLAALVETGQLCAVSTEVLFLPETLALLIGAVRDQITAAGTVTVADLRDRFKTSRKYALALLEYLDATGLTRREGDGRVLA
jgi:selenocysteine-specific elongation factor